MFRKDNQEIYRSIPLEEFPWLEHGFGTRHASPQRGGWTQVTLEQIHSDKAVVADELEGCAGRADGLITTQPGRLLSVRTADCLPVLIAAASGSVVAAVHAGWRGTAASISGKVVRRLADDFGVRPVELHVAIGPGIGKCCYEVGPDVAEQFISIFPELSGSPSRVKLDLVEANRLQLIFAGVPEEQIYAGAPCTFCNPADFHSYRREGTRQGRMISAIGIRP